MLLDSRNGNVTRIAAEVPLARTTANTQGLKVWPFIACKPDGALLTLKWGRVLPTTAGVVIGVFASDGSR